MYVAVIELPLPAVRVLRMSVRVAEDDGLVPVLTPRFSATVPRFLFPFLNRTLPPGAAPVGQGASGLQT
jgi:hypothetical protein